MEHNLTLPVPSWNAQGQLYLDSAEDGKSMEGQDIRGKRRNWVLTAKFPATQLMEHY